MAITKILNIQESDGRNPASHLKNALEYIQNPDKTEECVLVGGINCLPDTAFEQMEETKNIFHKTGKRQGYHVIISFSVTIVFFPLPVTIKLSSKYDFIISPFEVPT